MAYYNPLPFDTAMPFRVKRLIVDGKAIELHI
jgi:hypothetical protein